MAFPFLPICNGTVHTVPAVAAARRISRRYFTTTDSWGDPLLIINTGRGPALLPDSKAPVPQQSA